MYACFIFVKIILCSELFEIKTRQIRKCNFSQNIEPAEKKNDVNLAAQREEWKFLCQTRQRFNKRIA